MRKLVLAVVIAGLMPALSVAQVINTVGIARVASAPTHTPTAQGARVAIDTLSGDWYEWEPSSGTWREMGDRVQYTYTTGAPSFVPSKQRSRMALNAGDSLYVYQAGTWGLVGGAGPDLSAYVQLSDTVALVATKSNLVDTATFLVSDTILIYRRNGLEIGRDTIRAAVVNTDSTTVLFQDSILIYRTIAGVEYDRDTIRTRGSLTGSGTINYVSKFTAANVLGNSTIQDSSGLVGIGISPTPNVPVTIQGNFASASNPLQLQQTGLLLANNQDPGLFEANAIGLTYLFKNRGGGHVTTGYIRTLGYGVAGAGAFQGFMIQGSANNLTWTNLLGTTSSGVLTLPVSAGGEITYIGSGSSGVSGNTRHKFTLGGPVGGSTSGDALVGITGTYSTGSTLALSEAMLRINPTINSGSTGLYRGILIDPTLTAGPWRAIEARGETLLKGLGSTSATTALRVENSAGTDIIKADDSGRVTIGAGAHTTSGVLDVQSTNSGFLPPRMTTAQRNAIASPAAGLIIFCSDCTATDGSTGVSQTYSSSQWRNHY